MNQCCKDCGSSLARRHPNAKRCWPCAEDRVKKNNLVRAIAWRRKNRLRDNANRKKAFPRWQAKNREKLMLYQARRRAKVRGTVCELTILDIKIPTVCPVLGIPLGFGGHRDFTPVIDEVIQGRGYLRSNFQIISQRANRAKGDLSQLEMKRMGRALLRWAKW